MSASDSIRSGVLSEYEALEAAGLNVTDVLLVMRDSYTVGNPIIGVEGTSTETRYALKPNPEVVFKTRSRVFETGSRVLYNVLLKGAFFTGLTGATFDENGPTGMEVSKEFNTPSEVTQALQNALYYVINGVKYVSGPSYPESGGSITLDAQQTEWSLSLVKAEKQ